MPTPKLRFKDENGQDFPEWKMTVLGEIVKVVGGGTPSTKNESYWGGDVLWFTPTEIKHKYIGDKVSERTITKDGLKSSSAKLLPKNSLLLTTRASIGLCTINNTDLLISTNQGFQSLICLDVLYHEFMYYVVTSNSFYKELLSRASGSTFKEISPSNLKNINLYVPCLEEQHKIAEFLSTVDEKVEALEKKLEALNSLKKGFMQKIFSQELRFKGYSSEWTESKLEDLGTFKKGKYLSKSDLSDSGVPCILYGQLYTIYNEIVRKVESVTNADIKLLYLSKGGEILFPCSDVTPTGIACASYLPYQGVALGGDIHVFNSKCNVSGALLSYILNSVAKQEILKIAQGSTVFHTYASDLKKISVNLPSTIDEQRKIAEFLSAFDEKIEAVKRQVEAMKQVKKGLLQQMFV